MTLSRVQLFWRVRSSFKLSYQLKMQDRCLFVYQEHTTMLQVASFADCPLSYAEHVVSTALKCLLICHLKPVCVDAMAVEHSLCWETLTLKEDSWGVEVFIDE